MRLLRDVKLLSIPNVASSGNPGRLVVPAHALAVWLAAPRSG